jgi:hypothetical protein
MTKRQLQPDKVRLLREVILKQQPSLLSLLDVLNVSSLTVEQRESLREAVAAELCVTGLDKNDEPNDRGLQLEALIDYLGRL